MLILDPDRQYAINPGSIGQPRSGNPKASYMAYDHSSGKLIFRRVEYDIKEAGKRFRQAEIPVENRIRLLKGK